MEAVTDFIFLGSKIIVDGDYSLEIKRCLCLRRKAMTNLDSILKTFADKGFSNSHIWMWELDHKAEYRRIDAFELWCWRRHLRVPWPAVRSDKSILKEINPEYSLEVLIMRLKRQYIGHLIWRSHSLEKTLMLGKIESRRRGWWRMKGLDGITNSTYRSFSKLREMVTDRQAFVTSWGRKETDTTERLNNNNNCTRVFNH